MAKEQKFKGFAAVMVATVATLAAPVSLGKAEVVQAPALEEVTAVEAEDVSETVREIPRDHYVEGQGIAYPASDAQDIATIEWRKGYIAYWQSLKAEENNATSSSSEPAKMAKKATKEAEVSEVEEPETATAAPSPEDELRSIVEANHRAYGAIAEAKEKEAEEAERKRIKEENDRARRAITTITVDPSEYTLPLPDDESTDADEAEVELKEPEFEETEPRYSETDPAPAEETAYAVSENSVPIEGRSL